MTAAMIRCLIVLLYLINATVGSLGELGQSSLVPDAKFQVYSPKGISVSIPEKKVGIYHRPGTLLYTVSNPGAGTTQQDLKYYQPGLLSFSFSSNVYRNEVSNSSIMNLNGTVNNKNQDNWVFEDPTVELQVGDVIKYHIQIILLQNSDPVGYYKDNLNYTVTETSICICPPTSTVLRSGGIVCKGQTIFEDNFDKFRSDVWQIDQYIPFYSTEIPFVSYQSLLGADGTVSVTDGNLRIALKLQQNQTGFTEANIYHGKLDLIQGCTSYIEACAMETWGASILPPIISGKITSRGFAFTYGTVYVRAKLPQGDWVYPEILLEPFLKKYGRKNFRSGVLKIASARGNKILHRGLTDYSNRVLFGGPIVDFYCYDLLFGYKILHNGSMWGDDFHEYSILWAPDRLILSVDGVEWARVEAQENRGLYHLLPERLCKHTKLPLQHFEMPPFNDHFYLTLGMGVGGNTEFPDDLSTGNGRPKPWSNPSRKAMLNFWQDKNAWLPTWNEPHLLVDYIKVIAL